MRGKAKPWTHLVSPGKPWKDTVNRALRVTTNFQDWPQNCPWKED